MLPDYEMPETKNFPFSPQSFTRKQFFSFKAMRGLVVQIKESDEEFNKEAGKIIERLNKNEITVEKADLLYSKALDKAIERRKGRKL